MIAADRQANYEPTVRTLDGYSGVRKRAMPLDEYWQFAQQVPHRAEWFNGSVYETGWEWEPGTPQRLLMARTTRWHALIAKNLTLVFAPQFDIRKQTYLSETIGIACGRLDNAGYALPDVVVAEGFPAVFDAHENILNPLGVMEILSPSTRAFDRSDKLERYFECETLREVALIEPQEMKIEWYKRNAFHRWELYPLRVATEPFNFLNAKATVADVYLNVGFGEVESTQVA
jgi:Uma2 family endonuclease